MRPEPIWIRDEVVIAIHKRQIAEHGGIDGVRDAGLLASALKAPQQKYHYENPPPDRVALAASYAFAMSRNHPFFDGNKRVAFVLCRLFLKLNGLDIVADAAEKYQTFMRLASGELSEAQLADWLRQRAG